MAEVTKLCKIKLGKKRGHIICVNNQYVVNRLFIVVDNEVINLRDVLNRPIYNALEYWEYEIFDHTFLYNDLDDRYELPDELSYLFKMRCIVVEGISRPLDDRYEYCYKFIDKDKALDMISTGLYAFLNDGVKLIGGQQ